MWSLEGWLREPCDTGTASLQFLHRLIGLFGQNDNNMDTCAKLSPKALLEIQLGNEAEHSTRPQKSSQTCGA